MCFYVCWQVPCYNYYCAKDRHIGKWQSDKYNYRIVYPVNNQKMLHMCTNHSDHLTLIHCVTEINFGYVHGFTSHTFYISNVLHLKHFTSQTFYISNILHLKRFTSQTFYISNVSYLKRFTSQTFYISEFTSCIDVMRWCWWRFL